MKYDENNNIKSIFAIKKKNETPQIPTEGRSPALSEDPAASSSFLI